MRFGYHHVSFDGDDDPFGAMLDRARFLDANGFSWLSFMDHLWQISGNGRHDEPFFDCYTALPAAAAVTETVELSGLVTCVHYRNPALLGRMVTSLDHASDGRAVLGIGAGWFEAEYEAYGYEYPDPATRVRQMADTVRLIRALWTRESPVTYHGSHYSVEDVILEPKPVGDPHPPILIGGGGEQLTLRATADLADRWNIPGSSPSEYAEKLDVLRGHCDDLGRDYDEIEKTTANTVVIRDSTEAAHEAYEELMAGTESGPTPREGFRGLVGTPAEVADGIEAYADLGVELSMLKVPKNDRPTIERFVDDVMGTV
ncbi:MAG: TIGR03560 family F420-dependent LLM class oxidoreductase [Halobacteriales archaeon]